MSITKEHMVTVLEKICRDLDLNIKPKDSQIYFFCKSEEGISGFLEVLIFWVAPALPQTNAR